MVPVVIAGIALTEAALVALEATTIAASALITANALNEKLKEVEKERSKVPAIVPSAITTCPYKTEIRELDIKIKNKEEEIDEEEKKIRGLINEESKIQIKERIKKDEQHKSGSSDSVPHNSKPDYAELKKKETIIEVLEIKKRKLIKERNGLSEKKENYIRERNNSIKKRNESEATKRREQEDQKIRQQNSEKKAKRQELEKQKDNEIAESIKDKLGRPFETNPDGSIKL